MLASYEWLKALSGVTDISAEEMAVRLTRAGLEVEAIEPKGQGLDKVVVGEVRGLRPHPERDKLRLVMVFNGTDEIEVVCGASNVPEPGGRILFAQLGATLPGDFVISERKLGGVVSCGMICSESELGIGEGTEGIYVFEPDEWGERLPAPGTPIAEALSLRDVIFEIGLTPNRPDCLGHIGLAREVALLSGAAFEAPVVEPPAVVAAVAAGVTPFPDAPGRFELFEGDLASRAVELGDATIGPVSVRIEDALRCPRYGAAMVLGGQVRPSPFWLRYRLFNLGVRALSNIVDATNLVMLEYGHPIHGFDLERVADRSIVVRTAVEGEAITTLDEVERPLRTEDLLICDGDGPVALAGVMGGANSEIRGETRHVLIECAYFDPRAVRRTSKFVGLHTDASHRFERGVDPRAVRRVLQRAATLIAELGGGLVVQHAHEEVATPAEPTQLRLRHARTDALLGLTVDPAETERVLRGIGCEVTSAEGEAIEVDAPTWRPDLGREVDLIEEVARVIGFDAIPTQTPRVRPSAAGTPERITFEREAIEAGAAAGMHQAISFRFLSIDELAACRVPTEVIKLANPLSEDRNVMRTSLLPGLLSAAIHARRRQAPSVALFEVGRTFHEIGEALPEERTALSMLLLGSAEGWVGEDRDYDFYDAKGRLDAVATALTGTGVTLRSVDDATFDERAPFLHPRRRAVVEVAGEDVGVIGEIHPDVVDALGGEGRPQYVELSMPGLLAARRRVGVPQAQSLPRYPAVVRDIAVLVSDDHTAGDVEAVIRDVGGGLVEQVQLFDLYRGEQVPAGHRSLAFRVTYRDAATTLTDKKVDKAHGKVEKAVVKRLGASRR